MVVYVHTHTPCISYLTYIHHILHFSMGIFWHLHHSWFMHTADEHLVARMRLGHAARISPNSSVLCSLSGTVCQLKLGRRGETPWKVVVSWAVPHGKMARSHWESVSQQGRQRRLLSPRWCDKMWRQKENETKGRRAAINQTERIKNTERAPVNKSENITHAS